MTNIMASVDLKNWPILSLLNREFINGKVYALGSNTSGCLGTGDTHSTLYPVKIEALTLKGVKTFAFGVGPHVLALTNKGEVYSWGHNGYCELGNGSSNQNPLPSKVASNFEDKPIVYGWGQNTCGQVGSGISTNQNTPRKINSGLAGKKIIQIACGQTSSVAVTNNGEVYAWGNNSVGQLGVGTYINQLSPQKVTGLTGIVIAKVVCGYSHTMALSDEGDVYVWGGNGYGQLGLGTKSNACQPVKLTIGDMGRVSDIAAIHCNHISAALAEGGKVYMWGQCRGQTVTTPTVTPLLHLHDVLACYSTPSVMHEPLVLYAEDETSILDCLKQAFDDSTHSDLTIQVQGKPIYVHKAVLKIRCQYFRSMFQEHWTENNQSVIVHDEFSYDVYRSFLKYLYTDQVDLPPENALELMYLANAYFETQLKGKCVQMIKRGITINNVAFLYKTAIEYSSKELEDFCFKFALNHMTAVIQTSHFSKLDEATLKTFITKAAHAGAFKT
ncbi:Similar to Rcbtb1: RCC1 and BTB domain-containing protein 1 (Mus musculus) [Cotesia congregata]|uniref:Similar to Rcbtb1: RCC1 and BTB domain-containing protein 1 (Mus musculus) n=1 Tax=Cotesia congregata TaxID=51543 RepID=A0A8J2HM06_COTCN|nr:Similar to Rcbtb1: RCC1 and BTB domain-containing protein 1 (Mus musculus) [Cotesia congregata]